MNRRRRENLSKELTVGQGKRRNHEEDSRSSTEEEKGSYFFNEHKRLECSQRRKN